MKLRAYQRELEVLANAATGNVIIQADTGAGKTAVLAEITRKNKFVLCVAHRNLLVKQLSKTLAQFKIKHDIIATTHTKRLCILEHRKLGFGDDFIKKGDKHVVSIDSLLSHYHRGMLGLDFEKEWVIIVDEAHHMIGENKWGKLVKIFPNSRIIGATATPCRLDQKSLSCKKDGVFHELIQATELRNNSVKTLIEMGFLSDFKAYSIPERINKNRLKLGVNDYTFKSLEAETNSVMYQMAGDAVNNYLRYAKGKQALAFCISIDIAKKTADKFRRSGIASAAIHSKLSQVESSKIFDLFERKQIKVLVNVDMIGEGVDIPAIEALIMLRKTASFGMFRQWIGRSLRPELNKKHAILIDHVGNIRTHGLPDLHIDWDLDNHPRAFKSNLFPCPECQFLVVAWTSSCPECGCEFKRAVDARLEADVNYINYNLVEIKRKAIDESIKIKAQEKELREELQIFKVNSYDMPGLEKSIHKVKLWFAKVLLDIGISIYDLNCFFKNMEGVEFWISNFTLSDIDVNNSKCIEIYNTYSA